MDRTELFDSIAKSSVDTAVKNEVEDFGFVENKVPGEENYKLVCGLGLAEEIVKRFDEYEKLETLNRDLIEAIREAKGKCRARYSFEAIKVLEEALEKAEKVIE